MTNTAIENGEQMQTGIRHQRNPRGQGELLREKILDAADALLAESGEPRTLSLRGVAKRVGIAATSIYLHFPDVDDLKIAVVQRGFAELDQVRDTASQDIADPSEALLARMRAYAHFALQYPGRYRLMFGPELPPTLAYGNNQSPGQRALQSLIGSIERCQAAMNPRPNDDLMRVALMVWTAVHGFVLLHIDRPNFPWPPLDEMVNETTRRLVGLHPTSAIPPNRTSTTN